MLMSGLTNPRGFWEDPLEDAIVEAYVAQVGIAVGLAEVWVGECVRRLSEVRVMAWFHISEVKRSSGLGGTDT